MEQYNKILTYCYLKNICIWNLQALNFVKTVPIYWILQLEVKLLYQVHFIIA